VRLPFHLDVHNRLTRRLAEGKWYATIMANRAIWNVRKRHEWLATPLKSKRIKRAARLRCGLQEAIDRKAPPETPAGES
jgi:hypothetical protein